MSQVQEGEIVSLLVDGTAICGLVMQSLPPVIVVMDAYGTFYRTHVRNAIKVNDTVGGVVVLDPEVAQVEFEALFELAQTERKQRELLAICRTTPSIAVDQGRTIYDRETLSPYALQMWQMPPPIRLVKGLSSEWAWQFAKYLCLDEASKRRFERLMEHMARTRPTQYALFVYCDLLEHTQAEACRAFLLDDSNTSKQLRRARHFVDAWTARKVA